MRTKPISIWWRKTVGYRLLKSRSLAVWVFLFVGANGYLYYRNVEFPGIYKWSMYAAPLIPSDTFTIPLLLYNGHKVFNKHTLLTHQQGIMFYYTIKAYERYHQQGLQQSPFSGWPCNPQTEIKSLQLYPAWLKRYTQAIVGEEIKSLRVVKVKVYYLPDGRVGSAETNKLLVL